MRRQAERTTDLRQRLLNGRMDSGIVAIENEIF